MMGQLGTKEEFRGWLLGQGMTYTRYTTLPIPEKAALYEKYRKGRRKK